MRKVLFIIFTFLIAACKSKQSVIYVDYSGNSVPVFRSLCYLDVPYIKDQPLNIEWDDTNVLDSSKIKNSVDSSSNEFNKYWPKSRVLTLEDFILGVEMLDSVRFIDSGRFGLSTNMYYPWTAIEFSTKNEGRISVFDRYVNRGDLGWMIYSLDTNLTVLRIPVDSLHQVVRCDTCEINKFYNKDKLNIRYTVCDSTCLHTTLIY